MKIAKTCLIITGMTVLFISCKTIHPFTDMDKSLIVSGTAEYRNEKVEKVRDGWRVTDSRTRLRQLFSNMNTTIR
jgi:hypothetical protein